MAPSKSTVWAPADAVAFLRWVPEEQYRQSSDPDGASFHYLVHVDGDLIDAYVSEVGDPGTERPAEGFYLVHVGDAGQADAEYFGEDFDAATRATWPWVADYLEGEDPDMDSERPTVAEDGYQTSGASAEPWEGEDVGGRLAKTAGEVDEPTMHVESIRKPSQVVATATAVVVVDAEGPTLGEVLDHGLAALGETRRSLFGYGVEGYRGVDLGRRVTTGTYIVYANRD